MTKCEPKDKIKTSKSTGNCSEPQCEDEEYMVYQI